MGEVLSALDSKLRLSRISETDFDLVIVGFSWLSCNKVLSEKYFPFNRERRVLLIKEELYYSNGEIFVCLGYKLP